MDPSSARPMHVEVQCTIGLSLQIFEEITLKSRISITVEGKVSILLEGATHEAAKRGKTPVYQAVEKVVRQAVARGTVNEVIYLEVDNVAESRDFVQHHTSSLIKVRHLLCLSSIW